MQLETRCICCLYSVPCKTDADKDIQRIRVLRKVSLYLALSHVSLSDRLLYMLKQNNVVQNEPIVFSHEKVNI